MNEYPSRSELTPIDRIAPRAVAPVQAVGTDMAVTGNRSAGQQPSARRDAAPQDRGAQVDQETASVAEYAKIHNEIAGILADLNAGRGAGSVDAAASAIQSMMPVPIILVPLPPASKEAVEHVKVIARRMVDQAAYAQGAQAAPSRAAVEQVLASQ